MLFRSVRFTLRNVGKAAAGRTVASLRIPAGFTVVDRDGGTLSGGVLRWTVKSLGSKKSRQWSVVLRATSPGSGVFVGSASSGKVKAKSGRTRVVVILSPVPEPSAVTG